MNKTSRWLATGAAVVGMGMSMPSCPGQQAMQQQVDELQKREVAATQKAQALEGQVRALSGDMGQVKQLLEQVSRTVLAQKDSITQMEANVQKLAAARAGAPASSKHAASAKKSTSKHKR